MRVGARTVLVAVGGDGRGRVRQLLSTDPRDYLDPALAPGATIDLAPGGVRPRG
jgi:hypothetical protein